MPFATQLKAATLKKQIGSERSIILAYEEILFDTRFASEITAARNSITLCERILAGLEREVDLQKRRELALQADNLLHLAIRKRQLIQGNMGLVRR